MEKDLNNHIQDKMKGTYVVLDIETNGFYFELFHEVIEVAAIRVSNGQIVDQYHEYVKPWIKVPKNIEKITGITNEFLEDKRPRWPVLTELNKFIGNDIVVAYNSEFDVSFLNHWFLDIGLTTIKKSMCAFNAFKKLTGRKKNAKLIDACEYFDVTLTDAHSAIADTTATVDVFLNIIKEENKNQEEYLELLEMTEEEVFIKNKVRVLNANSKKKIKEVLLTDGPIPGKRNPINGKEDIIKLHNSFEKGIMFAVISATTMIGEYEIQEEFLNWVNQKNIKKYNYLIDDKVKKEVLSILKQAGSLEKAYELHNIIFEKAKKKPKKKTKKELKEAKELGIELEEVEEEPLPINKFIYKLVYQLYLNEDEKQNYSLSDFELYFESGKTLEEILSLDDSNIELFQLMNLFADWLLKDVNNRELYRSYIAQNILTMDDLLEINKLGLGQFIIKNPAVDEKKAMLTSVLYDKNFFKI